MTALVLAESRRLIRHPVILAALALTAAPWLHEWLTGGLATRYPVLHDEAQLVQLPMLLLAAGTLLAVNLAALRPQRDGLAAFYLVQPVTERRRTTAHLLSALVPAVLAAAVVALRLTWLATAPGAVGRPSILETMTVPLVVVLAGAAGLLLARLTSTPVAAPLVIAGLAMLALFTAVGPSWSRRLGPVVFEDEAVGSLPPELMHRPVGWHLLYLAAVVAALALLAVGSRRRAAVAVVAVTVTAVAQGATSVQPVPVQAATSVQTATDRQVCRAEGAVTYCAFPVYERRTAQWSEVVGNILRWAPPEVAAGPFAVRQRVHFDSSGVMSDPAPVARWRADDTAAGIPASVPVGTGWGDRDGYTELQMIQFSAAFANRAVTGSTAAIDRNDPVCGAPALLILWLGAQATTETAKAYRTMLGNSWGDGIVMPLLTTAATGPSYPREAADLARDLLDRPAVEVGETVRENWRRLAAPGTGLDEAAQLFGLPSPSRGSLC